MKLLDRLPIYDEPGLIDVLGDTVQVYRHQIIVWLSLDKDRRPFPAILDTGHSHNLSIARRHLSRWGGVELARIGQSRIAGSLVPQYAAEVYLRRNVSGTRAHRGQHRLGMEGGIAVVPDDLPIAPRLPLLGIQGILANRLKLVIDGKRREVTLTTARWF